MTDYESSPGIHRSFCKKCGSPIYYTSVKRKNEIDVFAATLDNPENFVAEAHYNWHERLSWLDHRDKLPKYKKSELE